MSDEPERPINEPVSSARQSSETLDNLWHGVEEVVGRSLLFRSVDADVRREIVDRGVLMLFHAGGVVLEEGAEGAECYLIDRGIVEVTTRGPDGGLVVLATLQRGAVFGEVALLQRTRRTATVTALTEVVAVRFDRADIDEVLDRNPSARRLLQAMIAGRARDAAEKVSRASNSSRPPPLTDETDKAGRRDR